MVSDSMINALPIVVGQFAICRGQLVSFRFDESFRLIDFDGKLSMLLLYKTMSESLPIF